MADNDAPVGVPPTQFGPQQTQYPNLPPPQTTPASTDVGQTPPAPGAGIGAPGFKAEGGYSLRPHAAQPTPSPEAVKSNVEQQNHGIWGRAARFLLGNQVDYQVDDKGNVTPVEVKQKPGQMFRSLLAGAVLGGAMGAESRRGFAGGFMAGAAGVQDRLKQADQQRYQRAVQGFNMRQQAQREATEQDLRKAQVAHYNAATATENFMLNKAVLGQGIESVELGKEQLKPFIDAGVPYSFRDIPASQMEQLLKTNPNAAALTWAATSYTLKKNEKGEVYPEIHYSAIDAKGKVKLTDGMLKQFDAVRLGDFFPGVKDLKAGQEMDAGSYIDLLTKYKNRYNDWLGQTQTGLQQKRYDAETKHLLAERDHLLAETAKTKLAGKELDQFKEAEKKFAQVGYDPTKLDPESYAIMAKEAGGFLKQETALLNDAIKNDPTMEQPGTQALYNNVSQLSDWVRYVFVPRTPTNGSSNAPSQDRVQQVVDDVTGKGSTIDEDGQAVQSKKLSPQESFQKIANSNLSDSEKLSAWKQSGAEYPWSLVVEQARKRGVPADQISDGLKKIGINVGKSEGTKAREAMSNIPESVFSQY